VAIADVDGNGCNDVVGAGDNGRGLVHLGDGAGNFDAGQDLPQLGYQDPATATRVTMAADDLTGDGLFGLAQDDRLSGGTGADALSGGSGNDRLNGDAGDDKLTGASGNDTISPGAGKDRITAGAGNDTISARDGARDTIDCGAGRDKVTADRKDSIKSNCERRTLG
jgi:Ca2+-binding RTX toxin-like protein